MSATRLKPYKTKNDVFDHHYPGVWPPLNDVFEHHYPGKWCVWPPLNDVFDYHYPGKLIIDA